MNETQANREQFPGIEFKDNIPGYRGLSRIFSAYQNESNVLDCMKYTVSEMPARKCLCVMLKYSESWWDCSKYFSKDGVIGALFEDSLGWYITKFDVERVGNDHFRLWMKLKELGGLETNIGPNLLEYIASLF